MQSEMQELETPKSQLGSSVRIRKHKMFAPFCLTLISYWRSRHVRIPLNISKNVMIETDLPAKIRADSRNDLLPFLKWAGGKRQLLPELRKYIPSNFTFSSIYFEPFIGAGAFLFDLQPQKAVINDANKELVNCYQVIKNNPEELLLATKEHQQKNSKEYYYQLRSRDRQPNELSDIEKAARIIYLNKTCFNGLFRVNSQGQFNVPYGDNKNPIVADESVIRAVSKYLNENSIQITNQDFAASVATAEKGNFIYFDPPYDPVSDTSAFTGYDLNGFDRDEQLRLKQVSDRLIEKGCQVLLSNSSTDFIKDLYSDREYYSIIEVKASRHINSVGTSRGKINELLIFSNYDVRKI